MPGPVAGLDDSAGGNAASVEGPHRELRARLADGLGGDRAHGKSDLNRLPRRHVHAIAAGAHAARGSAGQAAADPHGVDAQGFDLGCHRRGDELVLLDDQLVGNRVADCLTAGSTEDRLAKRDIDLLALVDRPLGNAHLRPAVELGDDHGLGHVVELAGQIAGVRGLEGSVGQALTGAVCRGEVFKDVQPLAEVRPNRGFDDLARGLGHQAAHARQLLHLADVASGAGRGHQKDRVQVRLSLRGVDRHLLMVCRVAPIVLERLNHALGHLLTAVSPQVQQLVVTLPLGNRPGLVILLHPIHLLLRLVD